MREPVPMKERNRSSDAVKVAQSGWGVTLRYALVMAIVGAGRESKQGASAFGKARMIALAAFTGWIVG